MKHFNHGEKPTSQRGGSTLVIVIALLGLLAFTGMVFFTYANQEKRASEYFAEAAKAQYDEPNEIWPHMLRQITIGAPDRFRGSILYSEDNRNSMAGNAIGADIYPHSGEAIDVGYNAAGVPTVTSSQPAGENYLNIVDSPAARGGTLVRDTPAPDVDYTYPDINNPFLAYRGTAIRYYTDDANGNGVWDAGELIEFQRVPVIIPSFHRPQYMKTARLNGIGDKDVPTDPFWAYAMDPGNPDTPAVPTVANRNRPNSRLFQRRSFRPHPMHLSGVTEGGAPVLRYLTDDEAADPNGDGDTTDAIGSGGFPFIPENLANNLNENSAVAGEMGIWTGSHPGVYELDVDNDGDGIREGIWLDLHYPVQEQTAADGTVRKYVVMYSVTIYDLDGLINLNVHGNLAGLPRTPAGTLQSATTQGFFSNSFLSQSNLGLGPNEVNPLWAMRRPTALDASTEAHFVKHFGRAPNNSVEQANMELAWLMMGRGEYKVDNGVCTDFEDLHAGRWGERDLLYNSLERLPTKLRIADLPRPGRSGKLYESVSSGISFGGRNGFDDNQNRFEGESRIASGRLRSYGHPMDFSGQGRRTRVDNAVYDAGSDMFEDDDPGSNFFGNADDPRSPIMLHDSSSTGPERWVGYIQYGAASSMNSADKSRYTFGPDGAYGGKNRELEAAGTDDLNHNPVFDANFEDPLETIFDQDFADRSRDGIASIGDTLALQMDQTLISSATETPSDHLTKLTPHFAEVDSDNREMFTTYSNTLRHIAMQRDDRRSWEYTADSDGDLRLEFPPQFGSAQPYTATDPFRAQVRRLLTNEIGEGRDLIGALPISINQLLDVERSERTPREGTPEFVTYMERAGMRFRPLTEHPDLSEGNTVLNLVSANLPVYTQNVTDLPAFPPETVEGREFWARRDRQQMARDIYVLLYTLGGARDDTVVGRIKDYTLPNDPDLLEGSALVSAIYTHEQLRRMAQFAVNMVDALDTDNVITKFEYDKNLGDDVALGAGWNLDDNPYQDESTAGQGTVQQTADGLYPEDNAERGVVYGVEAQQLAFSEVLGIRSPEITGGMQEHEATPYVDSVNRDFMYVELQNMLPVELDLATTNSNTNESAIWRVARYDRPASDEKIGLPTAPTRAISILEHQENVIDGGGRFSISAASDLALASSAFFLNLDDPQNDNEYELIAPNSATVTLPTGFNTSGSTDPGYAPLTDIDVIHTDHISGNRFTVDGNFLESLVSYAGNDVFDELNANPVFGAGLPGVQGFDLVLQRRMNPNLPALNDTDNPWIEVDRIKLVITDLGILATHDHTDLFDPGIDPGNDKGLVVDLTSKERQEPLRNTIQADGTADATVPYRYNTVKSGNGVGISDTLGVNSINGAGPFTLWQPHFDRNFASPGELLNVTILPPSQLTHRLWASRFSPFHQSFVNAESQDLRDPDQASTPAVLDRVRPEALASASAMFLQPDFPDDGDGDDEDGNPILEDSRDNRWYRLFQFVEVPSRVHRMLGNYLTQTRLPGKINMNTIRHAEVYAGLLDEPLQADVNPNQQLFPFMEDDTPGIEGTEVYVTIAPTQPGNGNGNGNGWGNGWGNGGIPPGAGNGDNGVRRLSIKDRWFEFINERDGGTTVYDAVNDVNTVMWIPGMPNSRPFRTYGHLGNDSGDNGIDRTLLRPLGADAADENTAGDLDITTNRTWLETGGRDFHRHPDVPGNNGDLVTGATSVERYQLLSKIMNNTTTVSNAFIVYSTAAYFEAHEDSATGLVRVGGRFDLDSDGDSKNDQQRAVFIIDRTELYNAMDTASGDIDWQRLVKHTNIIE
ncbi:MAG: hypothetical protein P8J37_05070 [Fuerstiella sp.]|nr:hypothetical protein [Fuerstiella sp.]